MADGVCAKCGATVVGADAKFCSKCGSKLQNSDNRQNIRENSGNALNVSLGGGTLYGDIRVGSSVPSSPYQLPSLDLSPSLLLGRKSTIKSRVKTFSIVGALSFTSVMFTIFGTNIFEIGKYFSFLGLPASLLSGWWFAGSAGLLIASLMILAQALFLRWVKFIKFTRTAWVNIDDKVYVVHFKRVCPYAHCRGVMEPKLVPPKEDKNRLTWMWVCGSNPDLHRVDYDSTQVDRAIESGDLEFLFRDLPS